MIANGEEQPGLGGYPGSSEDTNTNDMYAFSLTVDDDELAIECVPTDTDTISCTTNGEPEITYTLSDEY